jgi:hypothetical protein
MKSSTKRTHSYWDIWLRSTKQRLAAFAVCLMLALGIIAGGEAHSHVEVNLARPVLATMVNNSASGTMAFSSTGKRST